MASQCFIFLLLCVYVTMAGKLDIEVQHRPENCQQQAEAGDTVSVHYTGTLKDGGKEFDSSRRPGRDPISFELGKGMVIKGWEQGIQGMCVGEKRKLTIPPELAYGKDGRPPVIPGNAALIFETELVSIPAKGPGDPSSSSEQSPPPQKNYDLNVDGILLIVKFVSVPVILGFLLYHLYRKYTTSPTKKEMRDERKKQMKKRR